MSEPIVRDEQLSDMARNGTVLERSAVAEIRRLRTELEDIDDSLKDEVPRSPLGRVVDIESLKAQRDCFQNQLEQANRERGLAQAKCAEGFSVANAFFAHLLCSHVSVPMALVERNAALSEANPGQHLLDRLAALERVYEATKECWYARDPNKLAWLTLKAGQAVEDVAAVDKGTEVKS